MSCPLQSNSKRIKLTVHTSFYWGLRLTLCYLLPFFNQDAKKEYLLYDRWAKCCSSLGQIQMSEQKFALALQKIDLVKDIPEQLKSAFTNQVNISSKNTVYFISFTVARKHKCNIK